MVKYRPKFDFKKNLFYLKNWYSLSPHQNHDYCFYGSLKQLGFLILENKTYFKTYNFNWWSDATTQREMEIGMYSNSM